MSTAVTGEKGDRCALGRTGYGDGTRWITPWSKGIDFGHILEIFNGVKPRSADNAQSNGF